MSGITSVVDPIFSGAADAVGSAASGIAGAAASNLLSDEELQKQQSQRESEAEANAAAKEQELTTATNQQILQRNLKTQQGLARAKTYFASQGIDPSSGSPETISNTELANATELNDYAGQQLSDNINDINRGLSDLQSNDLLTRTQKEQNQLLSSWL